MQGSTKDLIIDIPLEASNPSPKEFLVDEALLESASKVYSITQKDLDAALREDKKRRNSGKMKSYKETQKSIDVFARNVQTQSTNHEVHIDLAGCSNQPQSKLPVCDDNPSEKTEQIKPSASRKRNAEKPRKLKSKHVQENNVAECSKPTSTDNRPCNTPASEELKKLCACSKRDNTKCGKLPKRKHDPETNPAVARMDYVSSKVKNSKDSAEPCLPRCVFCGASKYSQVKY